MSEHNSNKLLWKNQKNSTGPAIMESLDSLSTLSEDGNSSLNITFTQDYLTLHEVSLDENSKSLSAPRDHDSFLLIDGNELLKVSNQEEFIKKLNCPSKIQKVKVISIFGNTGDGKSHTMNHAIFKGRKVFQTSNSQSSCTLGVWAAFDTYLGVICLDTEGLLGFTDNEIKRTRLLLKVLAVSDVVVYKTRSERLHKDMFLFLGDASRAYTKHFQKALQAIGQKQDSNASMMSFGPSIIIFQETMNTKPLVSNNGKSPEDIIRERFSQAELSINAFSSIKYVGVQTRKNPTDFRLLREAIKQEIRNNSVRLARTPDTVYFTLKNLNNKFSGRIEQNINVFFDQYFTCTVKCLSCDSRCQNSMNHTSDNIPHVCNTKCRFQHQYQNEVHICKRCHINGIYNKVIKRDVGENVGNWLNVAQYVWSGYVLECKSCGEIYHSRKYWLGNSNPEDVATRTEIIHVWNTNDNLINTQNTAQWLLDSVSQLTEVVSNAAHQPTKVVSSWVADQINPSYWRSNSEIFECHKCHKAITLTDDKHHCRQCGEGYCDACSSKKKEVPERGWNFPVRVCDTCFEQDSNSNETSVSLITPEDVTIRQVTESVVSTISAVGSVLSYPKDFTICRLPAIQSDVSAIIKEHSRPSYWVPDSEITNCYLCKVKFIHPNILLHHCRACGRGVCYNCSQHKKPVPRRNWPDPVRVCDDCVRID